MSSRQRRFRPSRWLPIFALLGAIGGSYFASVLAPGFLRPDPVDLEHWTVIFSSVDSEAVRHPSLGEGTRREGGTLVLGVRAGSSPDRMLPKDSRALAGLEVALDSNSGPLSLFFSQNVDSTVRPFRIVLEANGDVKDQSGRTVAQVSDRHFQFSVQEGQLHLASGEGSLSLGVIERSSVEMSAESGSEARIQAIRLIDSTGSTFLESKATRELVPSALAAGAVSGALIASALVLGLTLSPSTWLTALVFLLPLGLVLGLESGSWTRAQNALFLSRTSPSTLARFALFLAHLPLLAWGLLHADLLAVARRARRPSQAIWIASLVATGAMATHQGPDPAWFWASVGMGFHLAWWRFSVRLHLPGFQWWLRDLPALALTAGLGWGLGLLPAVAWRLLVLCANLSLLRSKGPGMAASVAFLLLVLLPASTEIALRSTWIGTAWSAERLAQLSESSDATGDNWQNPSPFWQDKCTVPPGGEETRILYAGGSSAGGAYQFKQEPEVFFPARLHAHLCQTLAPGQSLSSLSVAQGNRNSFTISRSIEALLASARPDLVVLYLGVNELTANHPLTRKEMETRTQDSPEVLRGLSGLGASSRLITGAALLLRSQTQTAQVDTLVTEVPLNDFLENLQAIIDASSAHGARVLFVPEYTSQSKAPGLRAYEEAQATLARAQDGVEFFDLRPSLSEGQDSELLLDHNHMSRLGHQRVEELLLPVLSTWLPQATASHTD